MTPSYIIIAASLLAFVNVHAAPAFPGALGWAATTPGGRGGQIIKVTTLNHNGPGSVTEAVQTKGPRIVVFEVGGIIDLGGKSLAITEPFLTIAGQTAPSPGISLIRGGLEIKTHDVIIQHIRVYLGEAGFKKKSNHEFDGLSTTAGYNVIIDHCSFAWATDENLSASGPQFEGHSVAEWRSNTSHRVTFSNCIIAEGLAYSTHGKGEHSKGTLIHDNATEIAVVRNLYVSNMDRNPFAKPGVQAIIANNWISNPGRFAIHNGGPQSEWGERKMIPAELVVVGNVIECVSKTVPAIVFVNRGNVASLFMADNIGFACDGKSLPQVEGAHTPLDQKPFWPDGLEALPSAKVKEYVLKNVGARPWDRNEVDKRIIQSAVERTGKIINSEEDVGGYPKAEPTKAVFNPANWNLDTVERKRKTIR